MKKSQAFTLIELLVIISIVAVLATIGSVVFSNVQNRAQDSTRKSDVLAIAKALEANYNNVSGTYNIEKILDGTAFASGQIPTPPDGGSYFGDLAQGSKGFKICTTLSDSSLFCAESEQGKYDEIVYSTPFMGTPPPDPSTTPSPEPTSGSTTPTPTPDLCPNNIWQ